MKIEEISCFYFEWGKATNSEFYEAGKHWENFIWNTIEESIPCSPGQSPCKFLPSWVWTLVQLNQRLQYWYLLFFH